MSRFLLSSVFAMSSFLAESGRGEAQLPPVIHSEVDLGETGPLRVGIGPGFVMVGGEAFYDVADGKSFHLFIGLPIEPLAALRIGAGYSRHLDNLDGSHVGVSTVFMETLYGTGEGPRRMLFGPRLAYIHEARDLFARRMHGIGYGGMVAVSQTLGPRVTVELALSVTGAVFPGTDLKAGPRDSDGWSNAWLRELRLGLNARPW